MTETGSFIPPGSPVLGSIANFGSLAEKVGNTPLLEIPMDVGAPVRLLVKLEGYNPTGSVKDRACVTMLKAMTQRSGMECVQSYLGCVQWHHGLQYRLFRPGPGSGRQNR